MTQLVTAVKNQVKQHTALPFGVKDISVDRQGLIVHDRYRVQNTKQLMNTLGIKDNLSNDVFIKPLENWGVLKGALESIERSKRFGGVVSDDKLVTMITSTPAEPVALDFDDRIDEIVNAIEDAGNEFHQILFEPTTCKVAIQSKNNDEVDCGLGDLWKFGTTINLGFNTQEFAQFYLRLVCTNGMTTKENLQVRAISSKNIGKQYEKFSSSKITAEAIRPRVARLRSARASFAEVRKIAGSLKAEDRKTFTPFYDDIVLDYFNRGYDLDKMSAKQQRFVFTDQNLYDVFNIGTNLATHHRNVIGDGKALELNKACSDIFQNGPNLDVKFLDIYKN
jgi:hypothetical protein